ncbi:MAG: CRISPR system precrRNA processing endoribonuclease RAMP protein Cas6 [Cyanobacteria bacterium J06648_16]
MPQSLVINLVPEAAIPRKYLDSQSLKKLFFTLVSAVDTELGRILQADSQNKSFTIGPLQVPDPQNDRLSSRKLKFFLPRNSAVSQLQYQYAADIPSGVHCWWRISFLDDALFDDLSYAWEKHLSRKSWFLGPARLHVTNLFYKTQQPLDWANWQTYQQLYESASDTRRDIHLQFMTPAVFRQGSYDSPLPTRDALFHSLRKRWNRFSGLVFAPSVVNPIVPGEFNIHTVLVETTQSKIVGCLGQIDFNILGEVDQLTLKRINTLADFAFYAGVGRSNTHGMGITRRT